MQPGRFWAFSPRFPIIKDDNRIPCRPQIRRLPKGPVAGLVGIEGRVVSGVINLESPALKCRPGDHAMKNVTSKPELSHPAIESNSHLFDDWFDPIEDMIRGQVRGLIEEMIRGELDATLSRPRYGRAGHSEDRDSAA